MSKQKHVNAGLKSPADLAVRLEAGEKFCCGGKTIWYNELESEPFRAGTSPIGLYWSKFAEMTTLVDCEWWEDIPEHGVLCWVSNISKTNAIYEAKRTVLIENRLLDTRFQAYNGTRWDYASPLTPEEAQKYILGMED